MIVSSPDGEKYSFGKNLTGTDADWIVGIMAIL